MHILKEAPEAFPLPSEASVVKAAAGWAHCVSVTGNASSDHFVVVVYK